LVVSTQGPNDAFGKHEVKVTLATKSFAVAIVAAEVVNSEVEGSFEVARKAIGGTQEADPIDELARAAKGVAEDALGRLRKHGGEGGLVVQAVCEGG